MNSQKTKSFITMAAFVIVAAFVIINPWLLIIIGIAAAYNYYKTGSKEDGNDDRSNQSEDPFAKKEAITVEAQEPGSSVQH